VNSHRRPRGPRPYPAVVLLVVSGLPPRTQASVLSCYIHTIRSSSFRDTNDPHSAETVLPTASILPATSLNQPDCSMSARHFASSHMQPAIAVHPHLRPYGQLPVVSGKSTLPVESRIVPHCFSFERGRPSELQASIRHPGPCRHGAGSPPPVVARRVLFPTWQSPSWQANTLRIGALRPAVRRLCCRCERSAAISPTSGTAPLRAICHTASAPGAHCAWPEGQPAARIQNSLGPSVSFVFVVLSPPAPL